jgi:RNA methyltransferase, TrmH family
MFKIINSLSNPYIKQIVKLRKEKKFREVQKKVLIDHKNTIDDLVKMLKIDTLITTNEDLLKNYKANNYLVVTKDVMKKITDLSSPQEIAAVFEINSKPIKEKNHVLILDNISDPGNLGSLIRSANAFNFDLLIFSKNCTDPFNEKSLRATKGSIFFIPYLILEDEKIVEFVKQNNLNLYLADIEGENVSNVKFEKPFAIVLSSEAQGPSLFYKKISKKITIPIKKDIDSLNVAVAGSILMYVSRIKNV